MNDEEMERAILASRASFERGAIQIYCEHLPRALAVAEEIGRRHPERLAQIERWIAFAAKVRDDGIPDIVGETMSADVLARLHQLAVDATRASVILGTIAWKFERETRPPPSDPIYRALKGVMRRHREQREDQRRWRRAELERESEAATGAARTRLELERARVEALDIVALCLDADAI